MVMTIARTMIISSELPNYLWLTALKHAAYVKNRLPIQKQENHQLRLLFIYLLSFNVRQPIEIFIGRNINRSNIRPFGELVWIYLINTSHKRTPRGVEV
jgi:hypothetical protein